MPPSSLSPFSPPLPPALHSLRALFVHVFVLRCELLEIFERWSQLPTVEEHRVPSPAASPLLKKLQEKQTALDQAMAAMTQLQRQVGLERLERGRKGRRGKTIMGYDSNAGTAGGGGEGGEGVTGEEDVEWLAAPSSSSSFSSLSSSSSPSAHPAPDGSAGEAAGAEVSNAVVVLRLRRLHTRTREVRKELNRSLHSLFPGLHSSLATPPPALASPPTPAPAATSSFSSPSSSFLNPILSSVLRTCESLYGGGRSSSWKGLALQLVLSADGDRVVGLIASLPLVLRAFIGLEMAGEGEGQRRALKGGRPSSSALSAYSSPPSSVTVMGLSVMGWGEAVGSPFTRSAQSVFVLVQAQLTAAMQRSQPHSTQSKPGSIPPSSSSSPLYSLLLSLSRYHSLFSSPCALCHRLLSYGGDGVGFIPPVVRTTTGLSLHEECREGWRRGLPALYTHTSSTSTSLSTAPPANHPPPAQQQSTAAQAVSKPAIEQRGAPG